MTDQYKPLSDFAPFKAGERFWDDQGDVLTICDDCESFAWIEIAGQYFPKEVARYAIGNHTTPVTPIDRDDEEPKLWRDTTDAEKGALLLAHHEGKVIEWQFPEKGKSKDWSTVPAEMYWNSGYAYRVRPVKPSFLPLEAGKVYQTAEKGDFDCIHVDGKDAWLKRHGDNSTAYVWDANAGFAKSLSEEWDITGLENG